MTLDLPTLSVSKCWPLSELALPTAGEGEERLRELAGVKEGVSSTDSMACLAFLYLLTHICGDKLRYVMASLSAVSVQVWPPRVPSLFRCGLPECRLCSGVASPSAVSVQVWPPRVPSLFRCASPSAVSVQVWPPRVPSLFRCGLPECRLCSGVASPSAISGQVWPCWALLCLAGSDS